MRYELGYINKCNEEGNIFIFSLMILMINELRTWGEQSGADWAASWRPWLSFPLGMIGTSISQSPVRHR